MLYLWLREKILEKEEGHDPTSFCTESTKNSDIMSFFQRQHEQRRDNIKYGNNNDKPENDRYGFLLQFYPCEERAIDLKYRSYIMRIGKPGLQEGRDAVDSFQWRKFYFISANNIFSEAKQFLLRS